MSQIISLANNATPPPGTFVETLTSNTGPAVPPDGAGNINVIGDGTTITGVGNAGTNTITLSVIGGTFPETFTGNSGGSVGPDGSNNVNIVGDGTTITVAGNPGLNTLTISAIGSGIVTSLRTQDGNIVTPTAGVINLAGGNNLTTTGTIGPDTATISLSGITQHSLQVGGAANALTQLGVAADGQLPIGSVGANPVLANLSAGSGISITNGPGSILITATNAGNLQTITGNDAVAESPSAGNFNFLTANATVLFLGTAATETLDFGGGASGTLILGSNPAGISGISNVGFGPTALSSMTTGLQNIGVGRQALLDCTTGSSNVAIGTSNLKLLTTGNNNVVIGTGSAENLLTGSNNTIYGTFQNFGAGSNYTGAESNNILINNMGVLGDNNIMRLGVSGAGVSQVNKCFIAGIDGVNVGSVATVVTEASDQLGTAVITAGSGISVVPTANVITINAVGGGVTWTVITVNQTAAVNNGYICNKAGTLALALPAVSAIGDVIEVTGINTAAGWQITQAAGQQIFIGTSSTTLGATGTLTSTAIRDSIRMVCVVANVTWNVLSVTGSPTTA